MKPYQRILRNGMVNLRGQAATFRVNGRIRRGWVVTHTHGPRWMLTYGTGSRIVLDRSDFELTPTSCLLIPGERARHLSHSD